MSVGIDQRIDYVPPMIHVSVPLPPDLQQWIDSRVADGAYVDAADYVRDLLRRDRAATDRRWLKTMIDDGLASGVVDRDIDEVMDEIIREDADLRG